MQLKFA